MEELWCLDLTRIVGEVFHSMNEFRYKRMNDPGKWKLNLPLYITGSQYLDPPKNLNATLLKLIKALTLDLPVSYILMLVACQHKSYSRKATRA